MKTVNAATLKEWLAKNEAVLIDVREPAEHAAQNIPGAKLIPLGKISKADVTRFAGKKIVLHCQAGKRGGAACEKLLSEDPSLDLYNLEGGIGAWKQAGCSSGGSGKCFIPLDRQVLLFAGTLVLTGSLLGYFVSPKFFLLSAFFGIGLMVAGLTGFCGGALLLARMPWNQCGKKSHEEKDAGMKQECEFPKQNATSEEVKSILRSFKTVAMVGLSDKPERPSYHVAEYLQSLGYQIIPVNPMIAEWKGLKSYVDLNSIPEPVEIVDIFRKPSDVPGIVDQAIAIGAKVIWMQEGVVHNESASRARAAGMKVVMNKCMLKERRALG